MVLCCLQQILIIRMLLLKSRIIGPGYSFLVTSVSVLTKKDSNVFSLSVLAKNNFSFNQDVVIGCSLNLL